MCVCECVNGCACVRVGVNECECWCVVCLGVRVCG